MKFIFRRIVKHFGMFLIAIFFLTIEACADLLQPLLMSNIVDEGIKNQDTQIIWMYGGVMLGVAAIGALGAVMRNIYASRTSQLIGKELRNDLYRKVQTLSFENIDRLNPSSLITRITNDVTQIQNFINGCMRMMVKAPIICIGAIILIVAQTPALTPIIGAIILISAALIISNMKFGHPRYERLQRKLDRLNDVSQEFLTSVRVVKAFGGEEQEEKKFNIVADDLAHSGTSAMRVVSIFGPLINLTVNMGIVLLLWLSGYQGYIPIGKIMASVNYMTQILFALGMVSNALNMAVRATASSVRVEEILKEQPTQTSPSQPTAIDIQGNLSFRDVTFRYAEASRPSLKNISLEIPAGKTIGIIGATGSGKSTLVNLVPRFYDVTEGTLLLDGVNVNDVEETVLRKAIAVVPQKALLFSGSVEYNLRWGKEDATEEEIKQAAKFSCSDVFIEKMEKGYQTELGQAGVNLSGGQKQRLSLARALLRKPKILILDDCTSALDASTEAKVLTYLRNLSGQTTILLISQRISTVRKADQIVCLSDGCVVGYGSHRKLMEECEVYKQIYMSQIGRESEVSNNPNTVQSFKKESKRGTNNG